MFTLELALLVLTVIGVVYSVLSTYALAVHFRKRPRKDEFEAASPEVSILKPVCGVDAGAAESFLTFLDQDYEDYEVLFGVLEPDDPSIPVIRQTIRGSSHASLHLGSELEGSNNKVRILHNLTSRARGEILVLTDADTRVTPSFLREVTAPFVDESVGMVSCLYHGIEQKTFADALEGLHMTCSFAPGVACADALGVVFGLGPAIAIRKTVVAEMGGFEALVDYLADDYQLALRTSQMGCEVRLSHYVVEIVLSGEKLRNVLSRELRWAHTTRVSRPSGHRGLFVTYGLVYGIAFWLLTGFSTIGWTVAIGAVVIRGAGAFIGAYGCLRDREFPKRLYLLPVHDILSFAMWVLSYLPVPVRWRGRRLRLLKDGRMIPVK